MAKREKAEGFRSAAGLIRYFDAEEKTAFRIDPKLVISLCIITAAVVTAARYLFPLS